MRTTHEATQSRARTVIADDEPRARQFLERLLGEHAGLDVVGSARGGAEALEMIEKLGPDVVFLDIHMPDLSGLEVARSLKGARAPIVVFVTAYDRYAVEAFELAAMDYVLKPVRRERLERALQQARRLAPGTLSEIGTRDGVPEQRRHVCTRIGNELKLIPIDEVRYFMADQKYVRAKHGKGDNLIDDSLKSLETEFDDRFVRIHRSALVSVAHIDALEKTGDGRTRVRLRGTVDDDEPLLVSRRHLADVRRRIKGR
jgi:two-component system response regulator AlgR